MQDDLFPGADGEEIQVFLILPVPQRQDAQDSLLPRLLQQLVDALFHIAHLGQRGVLFLLSLLGDGLVLAGKVQTLNQAAHLQLGEQRKERGLVARLWLAVLQGDVQRHRAVNLC